jgi:hypothetical protein
MSSAIHAFRLRRLCARIQTSLYSDLTLCSPTHPTYQSRTENLRALLEEWRSSIPPIMPSRDGTLSVFTGNDWFNLTYSYSILLLYRGQLTNSKGKCAVSIFTECLQNSESICHAYSRQYIGRPTSYTWGALHLLFLAGLTYLHCLWTSPELREVVRQDDVSSTCTNCTMVLVVMAERWQAAAPYRDMFKALASRTMTMLVDKNHKTWMLPCASRQSDDLDSEDLTQWMAGIANTGMSDGVDTLLTGFMGDLPFKEPELY